MVGSPRGFGGLWLVYMIVNGEVALKHITGYKEGYLEHVVKTSTTTKARLLHYYPPPVCENGFIEDEVDLDDWCGVHVDHGCLTGCFWKSASPVTRAQLTPY